MISLRIKAQFSWEGPPCVMKLVFRDEIGEINSVASNEIALFELAPDGKIHAKFGQGEFFFAPPQEDEFDGDVVLCFPKQGRIERLFRSNSRYNTLTVTERCDQLCLMCSQPPRNTDDGWRFPLYEKAISLVPTGATICLSGGEPTLYKEQLLTMLENLATYRPDIRFHVLSNGQHFVPDDIPRLTALHDSLEILWGVPLYAPSPAMHEELVDKEGSFNTLMDNFFVLAATGANIELRTVVTAINVLELPALASFVAQHLSFIRYWAIMAMEPVGFAKANLNRLFFDHSVAPQPIHKTLDICSAQDVPVKLFNFPLCTVGYRYRKYCEQSISDWKRKYLDTCTGCTERSHCAGFFEWYNINTKWQGIARIR